MPSTIQPTLRDLRSAAGYATGRSFAEALGLPVTTYCRYERRPSEMPLSRAWAIADALGVSIDAVVGHDGRHAPREEALGPSCAARVEALDDAGRSLIGEWLDLMEAQGRSRLFPEGRR